MIQLEIDSGTVGWVAAEAGSGDSAHEDAAGAVRRFLKASSIVATRKKCNGLRGYLFPYFTSLHTGYACY